MRLHESPGSTRLHISYSMIPGNDAAHCSPCARVDRTGCCESAGMLGSTALCDYGSMNYVTTEAALRSCSFSSSSLVTRLNKEKAQGDCCCNDAQEL